MRHPFLRFVLAAAGASAVPPHSLSAQAPASNASMAYRETFAQFAALRPDAERVAAVSNLVLDRPGVRITLGSGQLALLTPVGGRVVGAVFAGDGHVTFDPPLAPERDQLKLYYGSERIDAPITGVVLLFADFTADQLGRLPLVAQAGASGMGDPVRDMVNAFKGEKDGVVDPAIIGPMLNAERNGLFAALVTPAHGDKMLFVVDPSLGEPIALYRPVRGAIGVLTVWTVACRFGLGADTTPVWDYRDLLDIAGYRLDTRITESGNADLDLAGAATIGLHAADAVGPWLRFYLDRRLTLDSARVAGTLLPTFKADQAGLAWVRLPHRLVAGDTGSVEVFYHGDMIDRVSNFFFIEPGSAWYPQNAQGPFGAPYDMTFHAPQRYPLVSIGTIRDSAIADRVVTSHWVSPPTTLAMFNLGLFGNYHVHYEGAPALNVLLSEEAHSALRQNAAAQHGFIPQQSHMKENVAVDVSNALKVFSHLFGPPPDTLFYVAEIPYLEGVSFPGMIDLSWGTFQNTSTDGFDEWFRAHETAHQWWGNAVRPATYRDAWLSEGLASYSALWFLGFEPHRQDAVNRFLDDYRRDILEQQGNGAVALGYRAATFEHANNYQVMTYEKGAWVFQMLRMLMVDIRTMNTDNFAATMQDFYTTYRGHQVTVDDFRRLAERHAGGDLAWFFDEWVNGSAIPTYHVAWRSEPTDDGRYRVHFRIRQDGVPAGFHMPVLVAADLGQQRIGHFRVNVTGGQTDYLGPALPAPVQGVVFDDQHAVLADVKMEGW